MWNVKSFGFRATLYMKRINHRLNVKESGSFEDDFHREMVVLAVPAREATDFPDTVVVRRSEYLDLRLGEGPSFTAPQ